MKGDLWPAITLVTLKLGGNDFKLLLKYIHFKEYKNMFGAKIIIKSEPAKCAAE